VALTCLALLGGTAGTAAADDYVALGDSYSSGTGTRSYTLNAGCERGVYAYPYLISQDRPNTSLTFVACSGATTADVLNSQVSSVTAATDVVTITIGGNDAGFSSVITQCALPWPWTCTSQINSARSFIQNTLPGRLDNVYNAIKTRAPSATVVVLGYPRLFQGASCNLAARISADEANQLNITADILRDVTRTRAQAAGFTFKDAIPPFIGHAVCSSSEWLNGLSNPVGDSYHPNRDGHRLGYEPLVRAVIG
jgi:lysophospholipase L1-like esterase